MIRRLLAMYNPCSFPAALPPAEELTGNSVQALLLGRTSLTFNQPTSIHGQRLNPPACGFPYYLDRTATGMSGKYNRYLSLPVAPPPWLPQGQPGGRHHGVRL